MISRPVSLVASSSLGASAFSHHAPLEASASVSANAFSTSHADLGLTRAARGNKLLQEGSSRLHNLISPSASVNVIGHFSNYENEDGHHHHHQQQQQHHEVSPRQQNKKLLFRTSTGSGNSGSSNSGSGNSKRPLSIKEEAGLPGEASPPQIPTRKR